MERRSEELHTRTVDAREKEKSTSKVDRAEATGIREESGGAWRADLEGGGEGYATEEKKVETAGENDET